MERTIETHMIEANDQPSASSFISSDGCFPSLFLGSLTTKFREYQNGMSFSLNSGSKLTSPESEYNLSSQSKQKDSYYSYSHPRGLLSRSKLDV